MFINNAHNDIDNNFINYKLPNYYANVSLNIKNVLEKI
jgi:hypothetical protein